MAARTGMTDLINDLRGLTDAGNDDYTIGTVTYWSDVALQGVLDKHRADFYEQAMQPAGSMVGGTVQYYRYDTGIKNQESGTAIFKVQDVLGNNYSGTAYGADYTQGVITWNSNTLGSSIYLTGRTYDLNAAAADVWRHKAANVAKAYDFSTDNHRMNRSQLMAQFFQMADYYARQAGPTTITITHGDMVTGNYDLD